MVSLYNLALILLPLLISHIYDYTYDEEFFGYYWVGIFFLGEITFSFIVLLIIMFVDNRSFGNCLSQPPMEEEGMESSLLGKDSTELVRSVHTDSRGRKTKPMKDSSDFDENFFFKGELKVDGEPDSLLNDGEVKFGS